MASSTKREWATDARALAHFFLDSYSETVSVSTEFKKIQKFIKYPILIVPFKGPFVPLFVGEDLP
jgi:hypothetical protein